MITKGAVIHLLDWASHKSRHPVRSTAAAEIIAADGALDEIVSLKNTLSVNLQFKVPLAILVDPKYFYSSLSSQRYLTDKSVCSNVKTIGFYHEITVDMFCWIRGAGDPADICMKLNSPLVETLSRTTATGIIYLILNSLELAPRNCSFG